MVTLAWEFCSPASRHTGGATSLMRHGSYSVVWKGSATWVATFLRTGAVVGDHRLIGPLAFFVTLGSAMRACQGHSDAFHPGLSGPLHVPTQLPA
jgi:uncharacterized membrane protein